ncbi:protein crumbs isoform X2 [Bacillus rossius redtenbacheri]|uniref:protein crumbs isoform X2 n=1 Tax=Bacillus rossius redtenbacheri TaxID=93214 RepID=UPI002FDED4C6
MLKCCTLQRIMMYGACCKCLLGLLLLLPAAAWAQRAEAYFNGSSYVRLPAAISLQSHTGLSFRSCAGGQLFAQHADGGRVSLELRADALVFSAAVGARAYEARLGARLLDGRWHYASLLYRLGDLTLSVAGHQQVVANSTYNSEILSSDLSGPGSVLIVGEKFVGCILQGPSIVFNSSEVKHHNVAWGQCPLPSSGCTLTDHCRNEPCMRHGTCISRQDRYECRCAARYHGNNCEIDKGSPCQQNGANVCLNNGLCEENEMGDYTCICNGPFTGNHCELEMNVRPCENNPCLHNGTCRTSALSGSYECSCVPGFTGANCETNIDECASNPCENGGTCIDGENGYTCSCGRTGYKGTNCEVNINECENNPCLNQGVCFDLYGSYTCKCTSGFGGQNCELNINECSSGPCRNGAQCTDLVGSYECRCPPGFSGRNCEQNTDDCAGVACPANSVCVDGTNAHNCVCKPGFTGSRCEHAAPADRCPCKNGGTCAGGACLCPPHAAGPLCELHVSCASSPCRHASSCQDLIDGYTCDCLPGWAGANCDQELNTCLSKPCYNNGSCVQGPGLGSFRCDCTPGFTGPTCQHHIDECFSNPCQNGGTCIDQVNGYSCNCTEHFMGDNCELDYDVCYYSPCEHNGTCMSRSNKREFICECTPGYQGQRCETNVDECASGPCPENRKCVDGVNSYECRCLDGFAGDNCTLQNLNFCAATPYPCPPTAKCINVNGSFTCVCPAGFTGENCDTDTDECQTPGICNNGICKNVPGHYECYCTPGFVGTHCDIDVNECLSQPCQNGGECENLLNSFSCTCAIGFTGVLCEQDVDECASTPCQNGGLCTDGRASFTCSCPAGLTGVLCETNIDDCESSPCLNEGVCIDGINSFTCNCSDTGYEGELCEINIDECLSNPCVHGGRCEDQVKDYMCSCYAGYTGKNCERDIDECKSSPCKHGGTCLQRSNMSLYFNENSISENLQIPPVFKREFSYASASGYECVCVPGIMGTDCEINIDECESSPCSLYGSCSDRVGGYVCECADGFTGVHCDIDINECEDQPCVKGTCTDLKAAYECRCDPGYGGKNCSVFLTGCQDSPCRNNGSCTAYLVNETEHQFNCSCPTGFHGSRCEKLTTMSMSNDSHVIVTTTRDEGYDFQFRFKTTLEDCVLAIGKGTTYYVLKLTQGRLNLHSSLLNKWDGVYMGSNLNNGTWQRVFVAINLTHLVLASNDEQTIYPINLSEGTNSTQTSFPLTYVGGPAKLAALVLQARVEEFVGCVEDAVVNGAWVLPGDGDTSTVLRFNKVEQGCPRVPQCDPNPCLNGGGCTDKWLDFKCQCRRPYLGATCQYNWTAATFCYENITNSIVKVVVNDQARKAIRNVMDVSMFIRTRQTKGDIFYMGTEPGSVPAISETLIVAEMDDGELVVRIQFNNSFESYNVPGVKLADGNNHLIQVVRNITLVEVKINGTEFFRKTVITSGQLNVQVLYLGGVPAVVRHTRQAMESVAMRVYRPTGINFKGVIQDVEISNGSHLMFVEFFPLQLEGVTMPSFGVVSFDADTVLEGVVSDDACQSNPCLHNGTCYVTWNDYGCACPRGYKGKMCHEMEFCQLQDCPEGSACRNLDDGYECIANITLDGRGAGLGYSFSQRSPEPGSELELDGVEMNYRSQTGGTILYIGSASGQYFSVSVYRDQVFVSWLLEDPAQSGSYRFGKPQSDGNWTKIVLDMKNGLVAGGFREMDEDLKQLMVANLSAPSWHKLLYEATIVVGAGQERREVLQPYADGATLQPLDDYLPPTATTVGGPFKGCLGEIRIGSSLLPYFSLDQLNAENLTSRDFLNLSTAPTQIKLGCELCFDYECKNQGWCESPTETYSCKCPLGFEGMDCSIDINECASNKCENNATCIDEIGKYSCACLQGWTGLMCETEINECASNPCQNNGTCVDGKGMFECTCTEEFMGQLCEQYRLVTCENMPCKNGSTCADIKNVKTGDNFTCTCAAGFEGVYCDQAFCLATPCQNGAQCNLSEGAPFCQCVAGYSGKYCETNIDDCSTGPDNTSPCLNGGMCVDGINKYTCDCSETGFEGQRCEEDIDECELSLAYCGKGICVNRPGSYTCQCNSGKCGIHCNLTDPCEENPCQNGGTCNEYCVDAPNRYSCKCIDGFVGVNCTEKPVGAAASGADIAVIVAPIVGLVLLSAAVGLFVFVRMARKKRATRGTYSPSQQEYCNPRVEMDNVLKPPPEERLI